MASNSSNTFFFIDVKQRLYIESQEKKGSFNLLYGCEVLAFAYNEALSLVALICPLYAASSETCAATNDAKTLLRVYRLEKDELTELLDEVETARASEVLWIENKYIVASYPLGVSSILEFANRKLRALEEDYGVLPFVALHRLALVDKREQSITFWDLQKNKVLETHNLPNRRGKMGKQRKASSTCGTGNFIFIANDDATVHSMYVTKGSIRELSPIISVFSSGRHRARSEDVKPGTFNIVASALSSGQVVVGIQGASEVFRFKYLKKEASLKLTGKVTLARNCELAAVLKERCLVKCTDVRGGKASPFKVVDLVFEQLQSECASPETSSNNVAPPNGENRNPPSNATRGEEKPANVSANGKDEGREKIIGEDCQPAASSGRDMNKAVVMGGAAVVVLTIALRWLLKQR